MTTSSKPLTPIFGLVDGNSFFASCEKVYRPDLRHRPVIVLSNNDGCVVARSAEAKQLGIRMGEPFFKIQDFCEENKVAVFSSNYELYARLSGKMMGTIASLTGEVFPYSIDESFIRLEGMQDVEPNLTDFGFRIRQRVLQWVGIPTCVGIGPTQTLAKYTNHLAKKYTSLHGVCNWFDLTPERQKKALACQPVDEIWGVGRQITNRLRDKGIFTALDLANCSPDVIQKEFNVVLARTVKELRGISCIEPEGVPRIRMQICRSRSFGNHVFTKDELCSALTLHAQEAARTLRKEQSVARVVGIILSTNRFRPQDPQYHVCPCVALPFATSDTVSILRSVTKLLNIYFRSGLAYKKAGVILSEISREKDEVPDMFSMEEKATLDLISNTVDEINSRFGKNTVFWASERLGSDWKMKRERLSSSYETSFEGLVKVH